MRAAELFRRMEEIRETPSRTEKEEILSGMLARNPNLTQQVFKYAMYPFWNYRIRLIQRNYPLDSNNMPLYRCDDELMTFLTILDKLKDNKLSGNKARDAVLNHLKKSGPYLSHWFVGILNQDLNIGIAAGTIKKYMPDLLPETTPMLCDKLDLENKADVASKEGWLLEPKLDGLRALAFIQNGQVTIVSRKGKDLHNIEHIQAQLLSMGVTNAVFDGELMADDWNKTVSILHTQLKHALADTLKFYIFDAIPLQQWNERKTSILAERKLILSKCLGNFFNQKYPNLVHVPFVAITKKHDLADEMKKLVEQGYEGGVLKNPKATYEWKRSKGWLKVKPIHEADLEIYEYNEGEGKNVGSLGAVKVRGEVEFRGKTYKIDTEVGSGFTDKDRDSLWARRKKGIIIQVEFQEVAMKKDNDKTYALRFPVFVRERRDK